ncbi:hypothetical protein [Komagataeibacter kakiaceti]|nr:hypothetical protein [Komagataeibacter kakiaceti]
MMGLQEIFHLYCGSARHESTRNNIEIPDKVKVPGSMMVPGGIT